MMAKESGPASPAKNDIRFPFKFTKICSICEIASYKPKTNQESN